jgi:cytochrome P450 family 135
MDTQTAMHDAARGGPGIAQVLRLAWGLPRRPAAAFDDLFDRYGDVVWISLPPLISRILLGGSGSRVALLRDPALIKPLLAAPIEVASAAEPRQRNLETLWGDRSLFLLEGPPHSRLRKLMLPRLRGEALTQ